jgi:hypothetical protein
MYISDDRQFYITLCDVALPETVMRSHALS